MAALSLFHTHRGSRAVHRVFAVSVFACICAVWAYRVRHMPGYGEEGRWAWLGMLVAEIWFGFYWILTQAIRWKPIYRQTFKDRLSQRFEDKLPAVDVFVCTADPTVEPPIMVVNTVLSVMAYDYPKEKLSVYLSDDGGSHLTFYALLEASKFARHWMPYCEKFKLEPRSPEAYFNDAISEQSSPDFAEMRTLYEEMKIRIITATELGWVPDEERVKHKGFAEWTPSSTRKDHDTILQILIDGRDKSAKDIEGCNLPSLVYLAREKRPQYHHNFKAGALNALIRISSGISNGQIILNVDCDMYSNNSQSIKDALCFFMDEESGHGIGFVQFPQSFENVTRNDLYGSSLRIIGEVEMHGIDGYGGPMYIGTGCFHRRESFSGMEYTEKYIYDWETDSVGPRTEDAADLEENLKPLASCTYEANTLWGSKMGLQYECPTEDICSGLAIHCRRWKSAYCNPSRKGFLGIAPTTLAQTLVQHKRWSEGDLQIFLSRHNPVYQGFRKISLGLQMGYCVYLLWSPNCLATIYYSLVPSLSLLKGASLFPQVSSPWFFPFAYIIVAEFGFRFGEFLVAGGTATGWWNDQRMWLYKRTSSYLFAFVDTVLWLVGATGSAFVITAKVADKDVSERFDQELMEFGTTSPMFTMLATLALINLFCFASILVTDARKLYQTLDLQVALCLVLVLLNLPLFNGMFFRKDNGRMPTSVTLPSIFFAMAACAFYMFL